MNNISTKGENIFLKQDQNYIVIDGSYIEEIKSQTNDLEKDSIDIELKEKVFLYNDIPFTTFRASKAVFSVRFIKKVYYEQIAETDKKECFSSDSGLILFIEASAFIDFVKYFSFDDLVDSPTDLINTSYWENISKSFKDKVALIVAPGIGSGYEFEGSGTYKIVAH